MWKFTAREGWSEVEDFLANEEAGGDGAKEYELAGYGLDALAYGDPGSFMVSVRTARPGMAVPYRYVADVEVGESECNEVAIPTLPDLIAFLREVSPLAQLRFTGLASAAPGWRVGGKDVAAFALSPDGSVTPLVPAEASTESGLHPGYGPIRRS